MTDKVKKAAQAYVAQTEMLATSDHPRRDEFIRIKEGSTYKNLKASLAPSREEIASLLERYVHWVKDDGLNARVGHFMDIESHEEWFGHAIAELRKGESK